MSIENPYLKPDTPENKADYQLKKWASYASVITASFLIIIKLVAFIMTDAVTMLASLIDSTIDAIASIVILFSIKHAADPADKSHRYGHGKIESLAALGQATFISASAIFLFYESMQRFSHPKNIENIDTGIIVMIISIIATLLLVLFQHYVIKKTKSIAINADSLHYKGDILINIGVIFALVIGHFTNWPYFDPIFAIGIMIVLSYSAFEIGKTALDVLMDKEISYNDREKIFNIVLKHKDVKQIHDLRTRSSGSYIFIEFHLELDGQMSLIEAHDITEELEMILYKDFPSSEVLIHQEPAGLKHDKLDDRLQH